MADETNAPRLAYEALRAGCLAVQTGLSTRRARLLQGLLFVLATIVWLTSRSLHGAPAWINAALLVCFVGLVGLIVLSLGAQSKVTRQQRLILYYDNALARVEGKPNEQPRTGLEAEQNLRPAGHLYEHDLDLLGPDSLFSALATVRTGLGEAGLAKYLLQRVPQTESVARQTAVRELTPQTVLREQIALLGTSRFQQLSATFLKEWLDEVAPEFLPGLQPLLALLACVNVALLLVGLLHVRDWETVLPFLVGNLALMGAICGWLRPKVLPLLQAGVKLQGNVQLLSEGLALLQRAHFSAGKLTELQQQAREPAGAVKELAKLQSQLSIVEQRPKEYFLLFSLLLAAGTQAAISIAKWKKRNAAAVHVWAAAWAEFEALNALGAYAFEHPENCWPELLPDSAEACFEASELAHPLLVEAVANDVLLDAATRFLLISGSNMSGKSTMMRSVGVNAVLAYAGAPVRARALKLTPLALGASLALTDSLAEGKSKFKAEVERLAAIVELSRTQPVLFLVDEIFSGTNSADRHTAAGAVLRALLRNGALGALSTHDLALTELADAANAGVNVHMASPDEADPLAFDYKLKAGVNTSSNALAIVRMMGLAAD